MSFESMDQQMNGLTLNPGSKVSYHNNQMDSQSQLLMRFKAKRRKGLLQ